MVAPIICLSGDLPSSLASVVEMPGATSPASCLAGVADGYIAPDLCPRPVEQKTNIYANGLREVLVIIPLRGVLVYKLLRKDSAVMCTYAVT